MEWSVEIGIEGYLLGFLHALCMSEMETCTIAFSIMRYYIVNLIRNNN